MASYAPLSQHAFSDTSDNASSPGPGSSPHRPLGDQYAFQPLAMDFDNLGGSLGMDTAPLAGPESPTQRNIDTNTSYARLDSEASSSPEVPRTQAPLPNPPPHRLPSLPSESERWSPPPRPPAHRSSTRSTPVHARVRAASAADSVDLAHPSPDLQAMQGAYIGNVERLERSAERLSMGSNLEEAVRQVREEQKRSDSRRSSLLNSPDGIEANRPFSSRPNSSGAYSPAAHISLSRSSSGQHRPVSKGSRPLSPLREPEQEGRPLDIIPSASPALSESPPPLLHPALSRRPSTSASLDTLQQANQLFHDFDGEYYNHQDQFNFQSRPVQQSRVQSYVAPAPRQQDGMVYYPAPVPRTLNLPKRLSKQPLPVERNTRHSQVIDSITPAARQSALWLPGVEEHSAEPITEEEIQIKEDRRRSRPMSNLPPQLRASTFFDRGGPRQEVAVKNESAVATLDSILDASAKAPVRAFTDHPYVGEVGAEVYRKEASKQAKEGPVNPPVDQQTHKKRRSSLNLLLRRTSSGNILEDLKNKDKASSTNDLNPQINSASINDGASGAHINGDEVERFYTPDSIEAGAEHALIPKSVHSTSDRGEGEGDDEEEEEPVNAPYNGPPTTLLAELQMRKHQQKERNRTAATAFPDGMHSTLLELDAIAQIQNKARRQKRVALAWQDPNDHVQEDTAADDDDVPLGVLFPGRDGKGNLESRRLDDNRPLGLMEKRALEDNEPLSQRRNRLLGLPSSTLNVVYKNPSPVGSASPVEPTHARAASMYTLDVPGLTDSKEQVVDEENETLAQRRARLRSQANGSNTNVNKQRESSLFADELISQFGTQDKLAAAPVVDERNPSPAEETLGQRKRRLQAAAAASAAQNGQPARPVVRERHSMTNILQAYPSGAPQMQPQQSLVGSYGGRQSYVTPYERQTAAFANYQPPMYTQQQQQQQTLYNLPGMYAQQPVMGFNNPNAAMRPATSGQLYGQQAYNYNNGMMHQQPGMGVYGLDEGPPLNDKQRDVIDNWRRSVMPSR